MKIDVHNHILPEVSLDLLRSDPTYNATITADSFTGGNHGAFYLDPAFFDPKAKLAELDSKRLDAAILSSAPPLFFYDIDPEAGGKVAQTTNQGLREFSAASPDRFRWMATLPMAAPDRIVAVLEDAVRAGAIGVEVGTCIAGRRLDEPDYEPFWAAAEKHDLPVMLHPAFNEVNRGLSDFYFQNVIGNQLETTIAIERLIAAGVLDRHPNVRVVLVHAGGYFPFQAGRLRHARTVRPELENSPADPWSFFGQVVVDTITHDPATLRHLIDRVGVDNVVMGTDLPFDMATPQPMTMLEEVADEATVRAITETNPLRLYKFGE
jgi:aminocarboxymuconate-semialdehyde decarboxylase